MYRPQEMVQNFNFCGGNGINICFFYFQVCVVCCVRFFFTAWGVAAFSFFCFSQFMQPQPKKRKEEKKPKKKFILPRFCWAKEKKHFCTG